VRLEGGRTEFDALAAMSREQDVYIGCSCSTQKNFDVNHCHTLFVLKFLKRKCRGSDVIFS